MTKEDIKWWNKPIPVNDKNPWYYSLPRSIDVEMTSYSLLTYLERNLIADSIPIMKWLVKQRNAEGGFASTQVNIKNIKFYEFEKYDDYSITEQKVILCKK